MRKILIAALFLELVVAPLNAQTPAQWRQDLAYLSSTLKAVHPEPFHATSAAGFESAVRSLNTEIPQLSHDRILVRMLSIVALLQDAHTHLNLNPASVYPVRIYKYDDGIFVTATRPEDTRYLGAEIVQINARPASAVYDSVQRIASGDNAFSRMEDVPRLLTVPAILHGLALGDSSRLQLVVKQNDGTRATWSLDAVASTNDHLAWVLGKRGPGGATQFEMAASADLPYQNSNVGYWVARDRDVLYARFNLVQDAPDSVIVLGQRVKLGFSDFGRRLLAIIDSANADKLVPNRQKHALHERFTWWRQIAQVYHARF